VCVCVCLCYILASGQGPQASGGAEQADGQDWRSRQLESRCTDLHVPVVEVNRAIRNGGVEWSRMQ